jgi:hypothetical protein
MKTGIFILLLVNSALLYSQNITEINELDTFDLIAGPRFGYGGNESTQWKLYKIISEKYSSEIIESEYFKTKSVTSKIYLYWILRERKWHNLSIIYENLMNYKEYKLWFSPVQCIIYSEPIEIQYIINYNYNNISDKDDYSNTNNYSEYFELSVENAYEINEQLYKKMLSEYLKLPYLDIRIIE